MPTTSSPPRKTDPAALTSATARTAVRAVAASPDLDLPGGSAADLDRFQSTVVAVGMHRLGDQVVDRLLEIELERSLQARELRPDRSVERPFLHPEITVVRRCL